MDKEYKPESSFQVTDSNTLVYNLRAVKASNGRFFYEGRDVTIHVEVRHLPSHIQQQICHIIKDALNKKFIIDKGEIDETGVSSIVDTKNESLWKKCS